MFFVLFVGGASGTDAVLWWLGRHSARRGEAGGWKQQDSSLLQELNEQLTDELKDTKRTVNALTRSLEDNMDRIEELKAEVKSWEKRVEELESSE